MRCQKSLLIIGLILSALTGCNQSYSQVQQPNPVSKFKVVTTFVPMYWFTKAVVGEEQPVELLIPPGTEVHDYQATPANVSAIATANVLVKNGIDFEQFLDGTVKSAQNSQLKEINASANIKSLAGNPHVWLDPVLAKQQVINIRDGLIAANPENKATYQTNATVYIQKLEKLDAEYKQSLQKYLNCTFISFHDAYPYLANRYQIKQVAVVEIPEDQLSPTDVQKTINAVKQYKAKAIFGEPGVDNKLLEALSQDLNLSLQPLDSLESGTLEPQHYFQAMQANLKIIESACK
jgi:zinc transport system substrate-binding protein